MPPSSQRQPELPLLVWESGDLHVFDTIAETESALEAIDVKNDIYEGFDAAGRLLNLGISVQHERFFWLCRITREPVTVSLAEEMPAHRAELDQILVRFLTSAGVDPQAVERMSHEEMVSEARRVSAAIR